MEHSWKHNKAIVERSKPHAYCACCGASITKGFRNGAEWECRSCHVEACPQCYFHGEDHTRHLWQTVR